MHLASKRGGGEGRVVKSSKRTVRNTINARVSSLRRVPSFLTVAPPSPSRRHRRLRRRRRRRLCPGTVRSIDRSIDEVPLGEETKA